MEVYFAGDAGQPVGDPNQEGPPREILEEQVRLVPNTPLSKNKYTPHTFQSDDKFWSRSRNRPVSAAELFRGEHLAGLAGKREHSLAVVLNVRKKTASSSIDTVAIKCKDFPGELELLAWQPVVSMGRNGEEKHVLAQDLVCESPEASAIRLKFRTPSGDTAFLEVEPPEPRTMAAANLVALTFMFGSMPMLCLPQRGGASPMGLLLPGQELLPQQTLTEFGTAVRKTFLCPVPVAAPEDAEDSMGTKVIRRCRSEGCCKPFNWSVGTQGHCRTPGQCKRVCPEHMAFIRSMGQTPPCQRGAYCDMCHHTDHASYMPDASRKPRRCRGGGSKAKCKSRALAAHGDVTP